MLPVLLAVRDAAVEHRDPDGRRLPRPAGPGADRLVPAGTEPGAASGDERRSAGVDDHAVDAAVATWRWRSTPTSTTRSLEGRRAGSVSSAEARLGAYAAGARRRRPGVAHRRRARDLVGRALHAAVPLLRRAPGRTRFQVLGGRLRRPPRTAPASCTCAPAFGEDDQARLQRGRHPDRRAGGRARPVHRDWCRPYAGHAGVRGQQAGRSATSRTQRRRSLRHDDLHPLVPALLALRRRRWSTRRCRRGSSQVTPVPGPDGGAQPADHLDARAHQGRPRSASGWPTPGTGRSAATGSGARRSRCGSRDDPEYPRVDVVRLALERDSGAATSASTAVSRTSAPADGRRADPAEPGRPDRPVDHAPGTRRCSTAGSSRARCRSPRCTTRSRTRTGSSTTTRPTSSSSTSPRRAAGSTRMHVLATALFDRPAFRQRRRATASCSARTAARCPRACATTPTCTRSSTSTARMRCAGC